MCPESSVGPDSSFSPCDSELEAASPLVMLAPEQAHEVIVSSAVVAVRALWVMKQSYLARISMVALTMPFHTKFLIKAFENRTHGNCVL